MKVEIFGMGCPNCSKLEENVRRALAIDGEMKSTAKVLNVKQVRALLS